MPKRAVLGSTIDMLKHNLEWLTFWGIYKHKPH